MEIPWRVIRGGGAGGRMGEKAQGIRNIIGRYKIDKNSIRNTILVQNRDTNSIGNGQVKELVCMTIDMN